MENNSALPLTSTVNQIPLALTFDDVLLAPNASSVLPADVVLAGRLTQTLTLPLPILSAAMDTVTEAPLAIALAQLGGLGILHRNLSPAEQAAEIVKIKAAKTTPSSAIDAQGRLLAAAATSTGENGMARTEALINAGADLIVIDTAHGHSAGVLKAVEQTKQKWPHIQIMAGNVATADGTLALINAGADCVKVGIGPGSICTTRIVAGVGVPQLTAVMEAAAAARKHGIPVVADGGLKFSGDVVKAFAAGAGAVMLGSMLAGTDEAPGDSLTINGTTFKKYRGMGSVGAMQRGSAERYFQTLTPEKGKLVPEGIEGIIPAKGPLADVVHQLAGGLRAGMGYLGAATITEMPQKARFVRITGAGLKESHPHTVSITEKAPNYSAT